MSLEGWMFVAEFFQGSGWETWPFGSDWENLWASAARLLFVAVILGALAWLLRVLYGPKGRFRDRELDEEARQAKDRALEDLEARRERGDVGDAEYKYRRRSIERDGP